MNPSNELAFDHESSKPVFLIGCMDYLEHKYPESLLKMHIPGPTPHLGVEPENHLRD